MSKPDWNTITWIEQPTPYTEGACLNCDSPAAPADGNPDLEGLCLECQFDMYDYLEQEAEEDLMDDIGLTDRGLGDDYDYDDEDEDDEDLEDYD